MAAQVLLRAENMTKRFPGVLALNRARLEVFAGEVHALIGENGAGKSTLVAVLAGALRPDYAEIWYRGHRARISSPHEAHTMGIRVVFQNLSLVPQLSVAENLFLGREPTRWGLLGRQEILRQAKVLLERVGASVDPRASVRSLSAPQRYLVEVAKAILDDPVLLILDEPTASLTPRETERLFALVRERRREGKSVVWITHRLEELEQIADRVTVMRDGRYVTTVPARETSRQQLISFMTGREYQEIFPPLQPLPACAPTVLEVEGLSTQSGLRDISFDLRAGEILGIGGLTGSGKSELGRALFGLEPITAGRIWLLGQRLSPSSLRPGRLIRAGVVYLPPDRRGEGLVPTRSLAENVTLPAVERFERYGFLDTKQESGKILEHIRILRIRPPNPKLRVTYLSGGNQQKVLLARGMVRPTRLFILDEPTQGVDVGAKVEVYEIIHQLARAGAAVVLISSDSPELLHLCHRILVLHQGRVSAVLAHEEATEERLLRHYFGVSEEGPRENGKLL